MVSSYARNIVDKIRRFTRFSINCFRNNSYGGISTGNPSREAQVEEISAYTT
jgi:hypothetical protein